MRADLIGREMPTDEAYVPANPIGPQHCPECRAEVSDEEEVCPECGYAWGDFRPNAVTQKVSQVPDESVGVERRRDARLRVRLPVLYSSPNLTVESMALNLSRSGVFVKTQILDEAGTPCTLTLLLDGAPALSFDGRVSRVVDKETAKEPLGLGIEFLNLDAPSRIWLEDTLARLAGSYSD
jgi:hypothetical protein